MTPFYIEKHKNNRAWLVGEEAKHCMKVMRKKAGESVICVDGKGLMVIGKIVSFSKAEVELEITERHENWGEKPQEITLMISPLHKADRLEWLFEKAVELGVTSIVPYIGKHTVKTGFRADRLERIMVAALKQSMRSKLPEIAEPCSFEDAVQNTNAQLKLIAHVESPKTIAQIVQDASKIESIALLIGPEGDFSKEEIAFALENNFQIVSLGNNRLRSETAALHILSIVKFLMGY